MCMLEHFRIIFPEAGRKAFWCINGPRILQVGYEEEEDDPRVMEACEQIGSLSLSLVTWDGKKSEGLLPNSL